jgi:hypothetical protein
MLLMLLAISAMLAAARHSFHQSGRRAEMHSAVTLSEARAALLGYALIYPELHPGQAPGYLPCPDQANTGSAPGVACHARDLGAFGRFPYRTLGLAVPASGPGQCLWYAVSGSFKHNPKALALNWDSPGQFEIVDTAGRRLGGDEHSAVAVLIAPGAALPGQTRPPAAATTGAQRCSGSDSALADLPAFLDRDYGTGFAGGITIVHGLPGSNANDIVAWLTTDDIFDALRLRPDFLARIDTVLDTAAGMLTSWLGTPELIAAHADNITADRAHGRFPDAPAAGIAEEAANLYQNWRDQLRFVACTGENPCLTATLVDPATAHTATESCRALVIFGGERRRGDAPQRRRTETEREDPAQYLEGENLASYTIGMGSYSGLRHYTIIDHQQPASEDILRCVH